MLSHLLVLCAAAIGTKDQQLTAYSYDSPATPDTKRSRKAKEHASAPWHLSSNQLGAEATVPQSRNKIRALRKAHCLKTT